MQVESSGDDDLQAGKAMRPGFGLRAAFAIVPAALAWCALLAAPVGAQVVGDDACPRHAVDIASFATCDGERVAAGATAGLQAYLLPEAAVPPAKRNATGLYIDARAAHRLKTGDAQRVVLVDIRSQLEVLLVGQAAGVDLHIAYLDTALPLRWDDDVGSWAMAPNADFAREAASRLAAMRVAADASVLLLCRAGERSARAADELAALGYPQAVSIVDGFEGDLGADGRRSVNGWKNAGLPWTARPVAALVYGVH